MHDSQFGSDAFPRPIPRRLLLAAKRHSAGALPVTAKCGFAGRARRFTTSAFYALPERSFYVLPERSQYAPCRIVEPIRAHDDHC